MTRENYRSGWHVQNDMRIHDTEERERLWSDLLDATGENTKSGALDEAARYYVRMAGGTSAVPNGAVAELLALAEEQGSVTVEEIADVLDTPELPVDAQTTWSVNPEQD